MSWWIITIVISIQGLIIFLVTANTALAREVINNNREWVLPWPSVADPIKSKFLNILDNALVRLMKIANHSQYVIVCIILTLLASIDNNPIVYVPFWAGIGFAIGHLMFYFEILSMGKYLDSATEEAEQSFCDLIAEHIDDPQGEIKNENICG